MLTTCNTPFIEPAPPYTGEPVSSLRLTLAMTAAARNRICSEARSTCGSHVLSTEEPEVAN